MAEFSLDKALAAITERFTPEQRAEMEARSKERIGRVDPNSPEARLRRFRLSERSVWKQIEFLQTQPESDLKDRRLRTQLNRLAEIRFELGDLDAAIEFAQRPDLIEWFKEVRAALANNVECNCPTTQAPVKGLLVNLSPRFKRRTIQTPEGEKNLMLCASCGVMYVN